MNPKGNTEKEELLKRLKVIKGHVCGIERMIEEEKGCPEVLTQLAAIKASIRKVEEQLLEHYAFQCLSEAAKWKASAPEADDLQQEVREVINTIMRFVR